MQGSRGELRSPRSILVVTNGEAPFLAHSVVEPYDVCEFCFRFIDVEVPGFEALCNVGQELLNTFAVRRSGLAQIICLTSQSVASR